GGQLLDGRHVLHRSGDHEKVGGAADAEAGVAAQGLVPADLALKPAGQGLCPRLHPAGPPPGRRFAGCWARGPPGPVRWATMASPARSSARNCSPTRRTSPAPKVITTSPGRARAKRYPGIASL